ARHRRRRSADATRSRCSSPTHTSRRWGCRWRPPPEGLTTRTLATSAREISVADNELEDLQKKAARLGGNVALLTPQRTAKGGYLGLQDYKTADVYKCAGR